MTIKKLQRCFKTIRQRQLFQHKNENCSFTPHLPFIFFAHQIKKLTIKNSRILIIYSDEMKRNRQNKSLVMIFGLVKEARDMISWAIDERLKL